MSFTKLHMVLLSPVHIGTGEELTPDEYFIRDETLHVVRTSAFTKLPQNEQDRLLQRIRSKHFHPVEIGHAYGRYANRLEGEIVSSHPVSASLQKQWHDNSSANQLRLNRMVHLPHTGQGYIPGSTMKGVFRTALLDILLKKIKNDDLRLKSFLKDLKEEKRSRLNKESQTVEKVLLEYKRPDEDPLKHLKLSDSRPFSHSTCFQKLTNHSRTQSGKKGVYVWSETACPGERISFTWQSGFVDHQVDRLKEWDSISIWMQALNSFYQPLIKTQKQFSGISPQWKQLVSDIAQSLDKEKSALICIGRHTGAEAKTLHDIRRIRNSQGKAAAQWKASGTTFWMDEDSFPLGWAYITFDKADPLLIEVRNAINSWKKDDEHRG